MAARLLCRVVPRAPVLAFRTGPASTAMAMSSSSARRAASCSWTQQRRPPPRQASLACCRFASGSAGLTAAELQEGLLNTLKLFDKVNPDKVTMDAHFINDLGLDSLDAVEIVMAFEDEFDVEITDEEAEKIFTLQNAFDLIKTKKDIH